MLVLGAGPLFIFWDVQFWNNSHPFTQFSYAQTKNQIFKLVVFWAGSVKKQKTVYLFMCWPYLKLDIGAHLTPWYHT